MAASQLGSVNPDKCPNTKMGYHAFVPAPNDMDIGLPPSIKPHELVSPVGGKIKIKKGDKYCKECYLPMDAVMGSDDDQDDDE